MKLKKLIAAMALVGLTQAVDAAEPNASTSTEKNRSALTGFVVGAATGGPIGAFAGTVIGGEVFGRLFDHRRVNQGLETRVADLQAQISSEKKAHALSLKALNRDLDKMLVLQSTTAKTQRLPIQFRTGSANIEMQYETELQNISHVLRRNKDARITLTGFADRRGEQGFNLSLSEDRVDAVQQYLVRHGVSKQQIISTAYGESQPLNSMESLENNFFDRRVLIELNIDIDPQLATR